MIDLTFLHRFWFCTDCLNILYAVGIILKTVEEGDPVFCDVCQHNANFEKCWKGGDMIQGMSDAEEGKVKLAISYWKQNDYLKVTIEVIDSGDLPSQTIFIQDQYIEDNVKIDIVEGQTHIIARHGPLKVVKQFADNIKEKVKEAVRTYRSLKLPENESFEI